MLNEERYGLILKALEERGTVKVLELAKILKTSESTIRRDLSFLDQEKKLRKIHGGASQIKAALTLQDDGLILRSQRFQDEKRAIGKYAAFLIATNDFVYIDAGTTTQAMVAFIDSPQATFVTNGLDIAKALVQRGLKTLIIGGEIKETTHAIIGNEALSGLSKYHFSKGFFGSNGIDSDSGYTTPDPNEAQVKKEALLACKQAYVLADPSKFDQIAPVRFGTLSQATIITTTLTHQGYRKKTKILEVSKQ